MSLLARKSNFEFKVRLSEFVRNRAFLSRVVTTRAANPRRTNIASGTLELRGTLPDAV
jgi:hypothetical protein